MKKGITLSTIIGLSFSLIISSCITSNRGTSKYNIQFGGQTGINKTKQIQSDKIVIATESSEILKENISKNIEDKQSNQLLEGSVKIEDLQKGAAHSNDYALSNVSVTKQFGNKDLSEHSYTLSAPKLSFKEKVHLAKEAKSFLKKMENKDPDIPQSMSLTTFLCYLALILLVPFGAIVAAYLHQGSWTNKVTATLVLYLLGGIPGMIYAVLLIMGKIK